MPFYPKAFVNRVNDFYIWKNLTISNFKLNIIWNALHTKLLSFLQGLVVKHKNLWFSGTLAFELTNEWILQFEISDTVIISTEVVVFYSLIPSIMVVLRTYNELIFESFFQFFKSKSTMVTKFYISTLNLN